MQPSAGGRLGLAIELHKAGRLAEAEKLYRELLQRAPRDANVLYLLGLTAIETNQHQRAADLLARSIRLNPGFAPAQLNLGIALIALNRPKEARHATTRRSRSPPIWRTRTTIVASC